VQAEVPREITDRFLEGTGGNLIGFGRVQVVYLWYVNRRGQQSSGGFDVLKVLG
jgi:hypothetical protein